MEEKKMNNYVKQLKEFKNYMDACFEVLMCNDETPESVDMFYRSDFTVTFRGKTVTLANGADVFQSIEEIIQTEIDNEEEF